MISTPGKLPDLTDTIVALSSAAGPGARAVVRLSGRGARNVVAALGVEDLGATRGRFVRAELRLPGFAAGLASDVYHFTAPRSYTGQDVIELHFVSCVPIVEAVIARCLAAGARAALPGEFTMRAFLAGKLDLTRAEAVLGVIEAPTRDELTQALKQLAGGVALPLAKLRDALLDLLAEVEAGLDFGDEDLRFADEAELLKRIASGLAQLTLLKKQLAGRALSQRPFRVVLAGRPNAGKSSLFNALCRRSAALVAAEPGTTRDYLEQMCDPGSGEAKFLLVDTAGLRAAGEPLEQAGQALAAEQVREADLVLWCWAVNDAESDGACPAGAVPIATKADLGPPPTGMLATSAATGQGLAELRTYVVEKRRQAGHAVLAPSLSRCSRHVDLCLDHLRRAHANVLNQDAPELLALDLRLTIDELGAMTGAVYTEDLLDRIFSRFCIGK